MSVLVSRLQSLRHTPLGGNAEAAIEETDILRAEAGAALLEAALLIAVAAKSAAARLPDDAVAAPLRDARAVLASGGSPAFIADRSASELRPGSFIHRLATPRPAGTDPERWRFSQSADRHAAAIRISIVSDTIDALLSRRRPGRLATLAGLLQGLEAQCWPMPDRLPALPRAIAPGSAAA